MSSNCRKFVISKRYIDNRIQDMFFKKTKQILPMNRFIISKIRALKYMVFQQQRKEDTPFS